MPEQQYFKNIVKRDQFIKLASSSYMIPEEYRPYFAQGIKEFANGPLSDETIFKMVEKEQSFGQFAKRLSHELEPSRPLDESFAHWKGYFAEWVTCLEYNSLKNKGNVLMTIVNPDTTSKADLLHLISTENGFKVVPGPDVKTGQPEYVLSSYERLLKEKYEIPFVDVFGHITTNVYALSKGQRKRLEKALSDYPGKKPLPSLIPKSEFNRLVMDYLAYIKTDRLPSERIKGDFKLPKTKQKVMQLIELAPSRRRPLIYSWHEYKIDFTSPEKPETDKPNQDLANEPTHTNVITENSSAKAFSSSINSTRKQTKRPKKLPINVGKKIGSFFVDLMTDVVKETAFNLLSQKLVNFAASILPRSNSNSDLNTANIASRQHESSTIHVKNSHTPLGSGTEKSPHARSGHPRTLNNGKKIWISDTYVNKHKLTDKND